MGILEIVIHCLILRWSEPKVLTCFAYKLNAFITISLLQCDLLSVHFDLLSINEGDNGQLG